CLECNFICNKCVEVCPNRANIAIFINSEKFKDMNQILHIDGLCNECGNCETFCPYDGAPYKDKFTLFWKEEDMAANKNNGFLVTDNKIKLRYNSNLYDLLFNDGEITFTDLSVYITQELQNVVDIIYTVLRNYPYLLIKIRRGEK
ncbi:MAG: putative selenate reductase subunit YgfK, partial [Promethearchaeota archaeon]